MGSFTRRRQEGNRRNQAEAFPRRPPLAVSRSLEARLPNLRLPYNPP